MKRPSVVRGWTAFGRPSPLRISHTPPDDDMETITAPTSQNDLNDDHAPASNLNNVQAPTSTSASPASQTQEEKDQECFRDSNTLTGYVLLDLAERYSTKSMVDQVNQAAGKVIISGPTLNSRMNNAMIKKAKDEGKTKDEIREALTERRKAAGIRSTRRQPFSPQGHGAAVTNASDPLAGAANTRDSMEEDTNSASMVATNSAPLTIAQAVQQQVADDEAFVDQQSLKGDKILLMAERYHDAAISKRICAIPGNFQLKEGGVATRIHDALKKKAEAKGVSLEQVRADLNKARLSNGVFSNIRMGRPRTARGPRKVKSKATVQEDAADDSEDAAPVAAQVPAQVPARGPRKVKSKAAVQQDAPRAAQVNAQVSAQVPAQVWDEATNWDSEETEDDDDATEVDGEETEDNPLTDDDEVTEDDEMTDDDGTNSQQGYTAKEVDAANVLLSMFSSSSSFSSSGSDGLVSEVHGAATILMDMHSADASLGAQPNRVDGLTGEAANANANDIEMTAATNPTGTSNADAHDVEMTNNPTDTHGQGQKATYAAQEAFLMGLLAKSKRGEQIGGDVEMAD
jgi:hypothetical protein